MGKTLKSPAQTGIKTKIKSNERIKVQNKLITDNIPQQLAWSHANSEIDGDT
jgi:hypothetical protein